MDTMLIWICQSCGTLEMDFDLNNIEYNVTFEGMFMEYLCDKCLHDITGEK